MRAASGEVYCLQYGPRPKHVSGSFVATPRHSSVSLPKCFRFADDGSLASMASVTCFL